MQDLLNLNGKVACNEGTVAQDLAFYQQPLDQYWFGMNSQLMIVSRLLKAHNLYIHRFLPQTEVSLHPEILVQLSIRTLPFSLRVG